MNDKQAPAVLDMDAPDFVACFRDAVGAKPGEAIEIITPQFNRSKNDPAPGAPPADWNTLRTMSRQQLQAIGLRQWEGSLMLLPGEWYSFIPDGFELVCINGEVAPFKHGETDNDIRFGCLAYGLNAPEKL